MQVQPYLYFDGRCEEGLEFYKKALGAEVKMLVRFKDGPAQEMIPPGGAEKVKHACLTIGETTLMASDGDCQGHTQFQGISLSLLVANQAEAKQTFQALSEGGKVQMPLGETFFSPSFGMVADRFGVSWMVVIPKA